MFKRKNLINRKFQLRTTFRIIGIILIAFIFIIAITGIVSTDNNKKIDNTISDLKDAIKIEKSTIEQLMKIPNERDISENRESIIIDHREAMKIINDDILLLKKIAGQNRIFFTFMIFIGIMLGIILYIYLIRLTNRISGPIYVLTNHLQDIMDGKKPDLRQLRKNDEFKEFYNQFINFLKKK